MMTSSRLPLALIKVCSQMEKPVAEPGAVVAGRIAGQAHDRVPQFGEAFSQILHVAGSLACAGPCFRPEPAGIGPASRHCVEIVFVAWGCERIEHVGLHGCKAGWRVRRGK